MEYSGSLSKIALILPYFGKFNNYFTLFLESCRSNPTIDWLIYTDSTQDFDWPENVHVTHTSFESFRQRAQACYDFPISLETPYKLCDFKPAYGEILRDDLKGYDFWGHCDCDLIFGNIRRFVTEDQLARYDRLFTCGHFLLYRNTPKVNAYYRTQTHYDWQTILSDPNNHAFDEWPGLSQSWRLDGKPYLDDLFAFDNVRPYCSGFALSCEVSGGFVGPYHGVKSRAAQYRAMHHVMYAYDHGTLERVYLRGAKLCRQEIFYVHMQKRSMEVQAVGDRFLIAPDVFLPWTEPTPELLEKLAPRRPRLLDWKDHLRTPYYILRAEVANIGKPDFCSRSYVVSLLRSIFP